MSNRLVLLFTEKNITVSIAQSNPHAYRGKHNELQSDKLNKICVLNQTSVIISSFTPFILNLYDFFLT